MYQNYPLALSTGKFNQPKPKKPLTIYPWMVIKIQENLYVVPTHVWISIHGDSKCTMGRDMMFNKAGSEQTWVGFTRIAVNFKFHSWFANFKLT